MKQLSILAMLLSIAVVSCTDKVEENIGVDVQKMGAVTAIDQANVVSLSDVQAVSAAAGQDERNKDREPGFSVECITGERGDTLLYVVQKERGGWTIFSSDKRVPPIVAESDKGSFRDLMQIGGAKLWIEATSEEMAVIKHLDDCQLRFTSEEIENNKTFWRSITDPDGFARELLGGTLPKDDLLSKGHYEYRGTSTLVEDLDSCIYLPYTTTWSQDPDYNLYCPLRTDNPNKHAPAGCVAIAGAQMLYFLHNHFGVPATAPSSATCTGNINSYTMWQGNYTTEIWNNMNNDFGANAAPLIANVGKLLNMGYHNDKSSAQTSDLVNVFAHYGISCNYDSYIPGRLTTSLLDGIPVILSAKGVNQSQGHAFIADRYKYARLVSIAVYEWVWDTPISSSQLIPFFPPKVEYSYLSPILHWIGMNWGWGPLWYNPQEWFTMTGDWIVDGVNYNTNRHIVHNFAPIQ